jgi:hypothetical protein
MGKESVTHMTINNYVHGIEYLQCQLDGTVEHCTRKKSIFTEHALGEQKLEVD